MSKKTDIPIEPENSEGFDALDTFAAPGADLPPRDVMDALQPPSGVYVCRIAAFEHETRDGKVSRNSVILSVLSGRTKAGPFPAEPAFITFGFASPASDGEPMSDGYRNVSRKTIIALRAALGLPEGTLVNWRTGALRIAGNSATFVGMTVGCVWHTGADLNSEYGEATPISPALAATISIPAPRPRKPRASAIPTGPVQATDDTSTSWG